jgi:hypothetical protein
VTTLIILILSTCSTSGVVIFKNLATSTHQHNSYSYGFYFILFRRFSFSPKISISGTHARTLLTPFSIPKLSHSITDSFPSFQDPDNLSDSSFSGDFSFLQSASFYYSLIYLFFLSAS